MGRALIGVGVAVGFISTLKLASTWFPPRRFALASGLGLLFGVFGAVLAGAPLRLLINQFGWRPTIFVAGLITALLAVVILQFVRNDPTARGYKSYLPPVADPSPARHPASLFSNLRAVLRYPNIWFLALAPGGIAGTNLTFAGLWGVPYIKTRFAVPTTQAALMCSGVMIASAVAGPILGWLSDWIGRRKSIYLGGAILTSVCWATLIYSPGISFHAFIVLMLLGGFGSGAPVVGFAYGKESVPPYLSGTVIGIINMGVMSGPTILQPAIGAILDLMWDGQMSGGVRIYDVNAFKAGFGLMIGWAVLGTALISRTQDTFCRQRS
jgi:MFS family permease